MFCCYSGYFSIHPHIFEIFLCQIHATEFSNCILGIYKWRGKTVQLYSVSRFRLVHFRDRLHRVVFDTSHNTSEILRITLSGVHSTASRLSNLHNTDNSHMLNTIFRVHFEAKVLKAIVSVSFIIENCFVKWFGYTLTFHLILGQSVSSLFLSTERLKIEFGWENSIVSPGQCTDPHFSCTNGQNTRIAIRLVAKSVLFNRFGRMWLSLKSKQGNCFKHH